MDYWEAVLNEVKHRGDETFHFKFTDLGRCMLRERTRELRHRPAEQKKSANPVYYLGGEFADLYLTKREAETFYYLVQGQTIPEVGRSLDLSARTVEFYVKNMKLKIGVKSKKELLDKLRHTDIMKQLEHLTFEDEDGS